MPKGKTSAKSSKNSAKLFYSGTFSDDSVSSLPPLPTNCSPTALLSTFNNMHDYAQIFDELISTLGQRLCKLVNESIATLEEQIEELRQQIEELQKEFTVSHPVLVSTPIPIVAVPSGEERRRNVIITRVLRSDRSRFIENATMFDLKITDCRIVSDRDGSDFLTLLAEFTCPADAATFIKRFNTDCMGRDCPARARPDYNPEDAAKYASSWKIAIERNDVVGRREWTVRDLELYKLSAPGPWIKGMPITMWRYFTNSFPPQSYWSMFLCGFAHRSAFSLAFAALGTWNMADEIDKLFTNWRHFAAFYATASVFSSFSGMLVKAFLKNPGFTVGEGSALMAVRSFSYTRILCSNDPTRKEFAYMCMAFDTISVLISLDHIDNAAQKVGAVLFGFWYATCGEAILWGTLRRWNGV